MKLINYHFREKVALFKNLSINRNQQVLRGKVGEAQLAYC